MIRPSALQLAEKCGLASRLAEQHPEASPAADRGTAIHREIARALLGREAPTTPEAKAAVAWARERLNVSAVEAPVCLRDPETDEVITEGTADLVCHHE